MALGCNPQNPTDNMTKKHINLKAEVLVNSIDTLSRLCKGMLVLPGRDFKQSL